VALPIMDAKKGWNPQLELLEYAYRWWEFPPECQENPKYSDSRPLFPTHDEWTIVNYVMEVLRPVWDWILQMSKRHTVSLHHLISVYNDMFNHLDGILRALAENKTQWKDDLFFTVKLTRH
jgi:hypothetical protein